MISDLKWLFCHQIHGSHWTTASLIDKIQCNQIDRITMAPRRHNWVVLTIIALSTFLGFSFVYMFRAQAQGTRHPSYPLMQDAPVHVNDNVLHGESVVSKLENATLKSVIHNSVSLQETSRRLFSICILILNRAELGNAAWKVLHTTMAKFPDKPTEDDSTALKSYIYLFARLYPCGDCGRHFQQILSKFPPQVASRSTAAAWACHVHNEVNKSLKKDLFDCSKIGDFYDCGCAEEEGQDKTGRAEKFTPLELEKNG